jgi:hypothetical protein
VNVGFIGRGGTTIYAMLNRGSAASSVTGVPAAAITTPARIGRYASTTFAFGGMIYEMLFSSGNPDSNAWLAISDRIKTKLGVTAW